MTMRLVIWLSAMVLLAGCGGRRSASGDSPRITAMPDSTQRRSDLTLKDFRDLTRNTTLKDLYGKVGAPMRDVGSRLYVLEYQLANSRKVFVSATEKRIHAIRYMDRDILKDKTPESAMDGTPVQLPRGVLFEADDMAREQIADIRTTAKQELRINEYDDKTPIKFLEGKVEYFADSLVGPDYFREYRVPAKVNGRAAEHFHIRIWFSDRGGTTRITSVQHLHYTEDTGQEADGGE